MPSVGIPIDEASVCLGGGCHVPHRLHARLDREGNPRCVLDLRLLLPSGTARDALVTCTVAIPKRTPEFGVATTS